MKKRCLSLLLALVMCLTLLPATAFASISSCIIPSSVISRPMSFFSEVPADATITFDFNQSELQNYGVTVYLGTDESNKNMGTYESYPRVYFELDDGKVVVTKYANQNEEVYVLDMVDGKIVLDKHFLREMLNGQSTYRNTFAFKMGETSWSFIRFALDSAEDMSFVIEDGVLTKYRGSGGDVVIPDGVTSIGESAFSRCTGLTSVTIPASVTSIGNSYGYGAFASCSSLADVYFGGTQAQWKTIKFFKAMIWRVLSFTTSMVPTPAPTPTSRSRTTC